MEDLITKAQDFARQQAKQYNVPAWEQIAYAAAQALRVSRLVGADETIVAVGAWLMDSQLGAAMEIGKGLEHSEIAAQKAQEILSEYQALSSDTRANIISCIRQHHGSSDFDTLEAEVCCNADCYKFLSPQGFLISFRYTREMPFDVLIKAMKDKVEEKWKAISLEVCRKELEPHYTQIVKLLEAYERDRISYEPKSI